MESKNIAITRKAYLVYLKIINFLFRRYLKYKSKIAAKPPLEILVSKQKGWQKSLQTGFANTQHKVTYAEFSVDNIGNFDLVIPLNLDDSYFLNQHSDYIQNNLIPVASSESIALCDDKIRFNAFMLDNGFSRYIPALDCAPHLPFIVKKRIDVFGHNSHLVQTEADRTKFAQQIADPDFFTQALVLGNREYATHIYFHRGKIQYSLNIEYLFDKALPIKGQDKALTRTVCRSRFLTLFSKILAAIEYEGICCINYKIENGEPMILEINPRVGGSFCEYIYALVDRL
ncbi:hypothetical protein FLL45_06785 [Aliikangiella marina]|uniref:Carbamoyl phosphate synthase ATP-binding domain-containing protein n=1 Tax=Aliikangiella marina TaxID=1712262 RepID=A0A545TBT4_9GAMM|nr:hypothetical protein [Aliikangiella marina]TQV74661.1 hypothetical protein FLL45_06785 [Aliikangiella marina]